ncbi:MAG: ABC transporter substrate-binding protein [Alphaproteobacteria bacterium]|nr:ABC transporter substrate-binding protein [Alphaproteobacteria bacterium]
MHRALTSAFAVALLAASGASAQTTLKMVPQADLRVLDSVYTTVTITNNYSRMVYDTLFGMSSKYEPKPQMVESYTASDDKLTWTFVLRPGLKFHDGSPVMSKDVVASFKRWQTRAVDGKVLMSRIAEFQTPNDRTFVFKLKQPYGMMLETLAGAANTFFILREKDAATDAFAEVKDSIGSGPFKFIREAWVPGAMVAFAKNADYVPRSEPPDGQSGGKVVKVDRVEWPYIPDTNTAVQALQRGEVDMVEVISHDMIPALSKDPNIQLHILDPIGFQATIRPNHLVPPFNNPKARQALFLIGEQTDYLTAMVGSDKQYQRVCFAPFICGSPGESNVGVDAIRQKNVARAKQLFAEAGYKGEPIVVMTPTDQFLIHTMTLVTAQLLREVGINVDLQAMDWGAVTQRRLNKNDPKTDRAGWHIAQTTWPGRIQSNPFTNLFASTSCDGRNSWGLPCDEAMEKLRLSYLEAPNADERKRIIDELQAKFLEVVPYVPIGQFTRPVAYRKELRGIVHPSWDVTLWNIEKVRN